MLQQPQVIGRDGVVWGLDRLTRFVDATTSRARRTLVAYPSEFDLLVQVADLFHLLLDDWQDPPDPFAATFAHRSYGAFLSAAQLASSGQVPEAFAVMRTCLEHALYANHQSLDDEVLRAWQRRLDDEAGRKASRDAFRMERVWASLRTRDEALEIQIRELYERTIDLGAHPNPHAVVSGISVEETATHYSFTIAHIVEDDIILKHGLLSCASVGVASLRLYSHIFPVRAALLRVPEQLARMQLRRPSPAI